MLSIHGKSVGIAGALAVLLVDTVIYYLNNTWQVGPPVIVNILIQLQRLLRVPHEHLIAFQLLEAVVDLIAVLTLLENGVEFEVEGLSGDLLPLGEGLVLLLELT